jgi:hypothetical protein
MGAAQAIPPPFLNYNIMERDAKGRFVKGNTSGISTEVAREYQQRSATKRKENRTVAEVLRAQLMEKAGDGNLTKLEYLTLKAITTHAKGDMTFKDLRELQKALGEDVKTVNVNGPLIVPQEELDILRKWSSKE